MSVKIVEKKIFKKGKHVQTNIYFDYYLGKRDGYNEEQRKRVKTDFYFLVGNSKAVKDINRETDGLLVGALKSANDLLNKTKSLTLATQKNHKTTLMAFIQDVIKEQDKETLYNNLYTNLKRYIESINLSDIELNEIDFNFLWGWRNHMIKDRAISNNSARAYFGRLTAVYNKAISRGYIKVNPVNGMLKRMEIKAQDIERDYLTPEELQVIDKYKPRKHKIIKSAFLFACYTGLRREEIYSLTWSEIKDNQIQRRAKKTGKFTYTDLHNSAIEILNDIKAEQGNVLDINGKVFNGLSLRNMTPELTRLLKPLKLNKKITFHSARRTFATLLFSGEVDIYTVKSLLNHSDIQTTLLYTKMLDKTKKRAINSLPNLRVS